MRITSKFLTPLAALMASTGVAVAQAVPPVAATDDAVVAPLFSMTFIAAIAIAGAALAFFLRKRSNRDATAKGLGLKEGSVNDRDPQR